MSAPSRTVITPDNAIVYRHLYELRQRGMTEGSIEARRLALARMARVMRVPLLAATAADLEAWRAGLRVTNNSVAHYASHARQFYGWAWRKGLIGCDPTADLIIPKLIRGLPRPASEEDVMAAVLAAPQPLRAMLVLAGWAGLRCKEIALLRRENVLDTTTPPVLIIARDATKGTRERIVPMSGFVLGELRAFGLPRSGFVFRRMDGKPGANKPARVSQRLNRWLHEHGLAITAHRFRHRFGTMAYRQRRDLRLVQELMGHRDPQTTAGYAAYFHADAVDLVDALPVPVLQELDQAALCAAA